jgi:hypothetical protein
MALICAIKIVDSRMVWIQPTERGKECFVKTRDETIADTHHVSVLHGKRLDGIHHALVVIDDGSGDRLSAGTSRCLADVFEDDMWLVTVPRAQLSEDERADLLETKFKNLDVNRLTYRVGIDIRIAEVKVGRA